jgi:hypothetical protein
METIKTYRCEHCKSTYSNKLEGISCEASHAHLDTLTTFDARYSRSDGDFPFALYISSANNSKKVAMYQYVAMEDISLWAGKGFNIR